MLALDITLFQGLCWHLGRVRAWMPMGLLARPLSKWDGVGTAHCLCQAPGCSWWVGPRMTGEEMLHLLPYLCSAAGSPFPGIYPCALDAGVSGQGRYRTPPASLHGGTSIYPDVTAAQCGAPAATTPLRSVSARKAVTQATKTVQGEKKRVLSGGAAAVAGQHRLLVVKRVPRLQRLP